MAFFGKVALITGGAAGIGLAYAKELLRNGVKVAIVDVNEEIGENAVKELNGNVIFIKADVTKGNELEDAFKKTIENFGTLDIVINNAGISNEDKWELEIEINAKAVMRGIMLACKYMGKDQGGNGGIVITTSSILGVQPFSGCPVYVGTKHFSVNLTRCFGTKFYYDITGIKFYALCPGATETALHRGYKMMKEFEKYGEKYVVGMNKRPAQSPDAVAEAMIKVMTNGKNGSVWVIDPNADIVEEKASHAVMF